ncbi:MAG: helicase-exonuclease AddAB subunit AddA, partial [Hungatella sp.]
NRRLKEVTFGRLSAARGEIDAEKKNYVTSCRDRVKKAIGNLRENYAFEDMEEAVADLSGTKEVVLILLQLAEEFMVRYQAEKREKNMVDFNDLEHYALDVLVKPGEGTLQYSETADELSKRYAEILVDEYQDSNSVQETLINSLSGERFGRPNVFMVGDVKQSIYKFRLARPELFMEKYETYTKEESPHQKIELHQNFRSRASVLESINDVFYAVMTKNLGNISYTEESALHPGALFEPTEREVGTTTELLLIHTGKEASKQADEELAEYTSREMEAKVIANKIRELTHPTDGLPIWDKEKKEYRIAEYGDIVILLRSISGWTDSFLNVLTGEGIPAYAETGTGYFNTIEVETVLSMLAVIDNPMQDISLAAVLRSPIVGVTDEELAVLMTAYKKSTEKGQDRGLYGAFRFYLKGEHPGDALWQKLVDFDKFQQEMRMEATYLPIHEVLYRVFVKTGYYDYVAAMPAGEVRRANLDMLVEKASAYEKTSYKGLFHFIRYIENLKKYDTDFGEASVVGQQEHTVRLMSIHKSKGLEFPVVILAGMGKLFNRQDVRGKLLIDSDLGIGTDYFDLERRLKASTLKKNVLKRKMELDNLGEELRVLYVAMTRAKEKLILTAADRYLDKKMERWAQIPWNETRIPYTILSTAGSCLDWLLMSLSRPTGRITVEEIAVEELVGEEVVRQIEKRSSKEKLSVQQLKGDYDPIFLKDLQEALEFRYPYEADVNLHTKMSVSELKYRSQEALEPDNPYQPMIPEFLKEGTEFLYSGGAGRGTAYHRILELWDLAGAESREDCTVVLEKFVTEKQLTPESRDQIDPQVLWQFVQSPLGQRMKKAQAEHRCHKEQQFVIGIPAVKMNLGESEELVLVQGIIDAYFEEADHLVLIDYKTDRIHPGQEILLLNRYRTQLDYYQMALEQITGKKVTERILYSLALQKEIK